MSLFKDISAIILAFIIGAIQLLYNCFDEDKPFYQLGVIKYVMDHSIVIIGICCIVIVAVTIIGFFIEKKTAKKKWLSSVLQEIVDKYLCGKNYHTRVTIFKLTRNNKYLKCYVRFGYPQNLCHAPRKIPISTVEGQYIGVVGKCLYEADAVESHAESLDGINFAKTLDKNVPHNRERIIKYMQQTHISDYDVLSRMNRKSTNFYAYPIISKDANIWGVLIIDNNEKKEFDFSPVKDVIRSYADIISLTLGI